jgi:hypothetical protein
MKKLSIKALLFALPFLLFFLTIIFTDPYNYFGIFKVIPDNAKEKISYPINTILWKVIQFQRHPSENILLGDSRMHGMDVEKIKQITGEEYFNFGFGGATIAEMYQVFLYATKKVKLKKIYIGLNFNLYNAWNNRDIAQQTIESIDNPFSYFLNLNVCESSYYIISSLFSNKPTDLGNPGKTRAEFWKFQLTEGIKKYYAAYQYSEPYYNMLNFIQHYCKNNNIQLTFIIFPTHEDLQAKVTEYKLNSAYDKFKTDIKTLGRSFDFDISHILNRDSSNFTDPFHYNKAYGERLICIVWESALKLVGKWKIIAPQMFDENKNIRDVYYTFTRSRLIIETGMPGNSGYSKLEVVILFKSDNGKQLKLEAIDPIGSKRYDLLINLKDNNRLEFINEMKQVTLLEKVQ